MDNQSYGLPSSIDSASTRSSEQTSLKALSAITSRKFGAASTVQFSEFPEKPPEADYVEPSKAVLPYSGKNSEIARQKARISNKVEVIPSVKSVGKSIDTASKSKSSNKSQAPQSSTEEAFLRGARVLSAPVNYEQYLKMPRLDIHDFEALFGELEPELGGQSFVQFDEEGISEEQTETDMKNMEGRLKMTVQQVKEKVLGSHKGFEDFREFLQGTSGEHLLSFWLECENFKDTMEDFDDIENMEIRNAYFRDIQDKFKLKLTVDALDQITRAASNMGLSHTIFLRTQYDVLRRLRAYWVPRFLIHCEMTRAINLEDEENMTPTALPIQASKSVTVDPATIKPAGRTHLPFFPCISLVHSMPVLPEDARDYANRLLMNVEYDNSNNSLRRMFPRQRSTLSASSRMSVSSSKRSTKERFILALAADRLAGGPFQRYLARLDNSQLLASLLFWEDVTEYGATEDHSSDRLLRLCHAWNIYSKYLSQDSPHKIELPEKERDRLQHSLEKARDFMEASIFDHAKDLAVEKLEKAWIRFLKEDLKTFLDCRVKPGGESPPSTAEAIEITVTEYDVVIKRPRPWVRRMPGSTASERARRLNKALMMAEDIDGEKRAQRRAEILAKRKEMEKERRRAIKAAYARQREAKRKKTSIDSAQGRLDEDLPEGEEGDAGAERGDKAPTFQDMTGNRQIMSMFRKYVNEGENKDLANLMLLYNDVETYFALRENKIKKDAQANHIAKSYLDPQGKKYAPLNNDKLTSRLAQEKDRPRTPVLKEIQRTVLPRVEEVFKDFIAKQAEDFGMDPRDLATMSQSELAMRMGNEQAMMSGWNKRKSRGKHELAETTYHYTASQGHGHHAHPHGHVAPGHHPHPHGHVAPGHHPHPPGHVAPGHHPHPPGHVAPGHPPHPHGQATHGHHLHPHDHVAAGHYLYPHGRVTSPGSHGPVSGGSPASYHMGSIPHTRRGGRKKSEVSIISWTSTSTDSTVRLSRASSSSSTKPQTTGRAQATREDKNEFLGALGQCAMGQLTMPMLYFYKYLLKHGEEDGIPQIDKDLFFYIEVQKFKDGSHNFSDEEMLKRKVQSIVDCFLDSVYTPTLQIDIPADMQQRTLKAAQRYLSGKEAVATIFDDAQFHVFKELLFYWAGYKRAVATPEDTRKRPVTKYDKMLRRRMENIQNYQTPTSDFTLPSIPEGAVPSFTISLSEGVKFKMYTPPPSRSSGSGSVADSLASLQGDIIPDLQHRELEDSAGGTPLPEQANKEHRGSKATVLGPDGQPKRSRGQSRRESIIAR